MAERIPWDIYSNRVNGQSPFSVGRVDFVHAYERAEDLLSNAAKHPFVNKIRTVPVPSRTDVVNFAKKSGREWIDNVAPWKMKDKSTAWWIGYGIGVVESAAFVLLLPGSGVIKGAANFALTQALFFATKDSATWNAYAKDLSKGVSAGGAYASPILGIGDQLFHNFRLPSINMPTLRAPEIKLPTPTADTLTKPGIKPTIAATGTPTTAPTETVIPTRTPTIAPTETPRPTTTAIPTTQPEHTPAPAATTAPTAPEKTDIIQPRPAAAAPAQAPAAAPASVPAPEAAPNVAPTVQTPPHVDAPPVVEGPKNPTSFQEKLAKFLAENKDDPSMITDHLVARGETAGHLLVQVDAPVSWDGADWQSFATLWAMNPESFKDIQSAMGLSDAEFAQLVTRMANHDKAAYDQLIKHMSLLRAGSHVKMLTAAGMKKFLS